MCLVIGKFPWYHIFKLSPCLPVSTNAYRKKLLGLLLFITKQIKRNYGFWWLEQSIEDYVNKMAREANTIQQEGEAETPRQKCGSEESSDCAPDPTAEKQSMMGNETKMLKKYGGRNMTSSQLQAYGPASLNCLHQTLPFPVLYSGQEPCPHLYSRKCIKQTFKVLVFKIHTQIQIMQCQHNLYVST